MQVNVNSPSTIRIRFTETMPRLFKMFNSKGQLYYFRNLDGKTPRIKFNIPDPDTYTTEQPIEVVKVSKIEIPDKLPILPPAERDRLKKSEVKVNPTLKGTPARIFTETGLIEVSPEFLKLPPAIKLFLLIHEEGHYFYKSEEYCDLYALVNFIRMGYNRSTGYYALSRVLSRSEQNMKRIDEIFKQIQKYTGTFDPGI